MTKPAIAVAQKTRHLKTYWDQAKSERNWLVYRLVEREGQKPQKIPQSSAGTNTGAQAAAILTFDEAQTVAARLGEGIGIG